MACAQCTYKGYIVSNFNSLNATVRVCPHCNDVKAFSEYVMARSNIIPVQARPQLTSLGVVPAPQEMWLKFTTPEGCAVFNFPAYKLKKAGIIR